MWREKERTTETNGHTDRGTEAEVAEWRTRNTERGIGIVREMVEVREIEREREREKAKGGESAVGLKRSQGERRMIVSMITMERGRRKRGDGRAGGGG